MSRRVLVTGGFGYVGGRIAAYLAARPDVNVVVTSRTPDRAPHVSFPIERVDYLDLSHPVAPELCDGVDTVIHLAGANEIYSAREPERAIDINVAGTVRLLAAARAAGVRRFIFFSSASVYGGSPAGHIHEATLPRPRHPYAVTNRAAEDFVLAETRLTPVVVRLSNGVGWPVWAGVDRWTLVANDLCRQAVRDGVMRLKSSGRQERDFVALSDVARAAAHLCDVESAALGDGLFNVGGSADGAASASSIAAIARRIQLRARAALGREIPLELGPPDETPAAPPLRFESAKFAATGFTWSGDLDAEIDGTLRLCRETFGAERSTP